LRSSGAALAPPDPDDPCVAFALVRAGRLRATAFVAKRSGALAASHECLPSKPIVGIFCATAPVANTSGDGVASTVGKALSSQSN
jgi:hypothetical protein